MFNVQVMNIDQSKTVGEWLALIDQYVSKHTLIMGWSLGGNLAIKYASCAQKKFLGLITLQTNPCFITHDRWTHALSIAEFLALYELVKNDDQKAIVRRFTHLLVSGSRQHKADRRHLKKCYSEASLQDSTVLLSGLELLRDLDVSEDLLAITVPCLFFLGAEDVLVPKGVAKDIATLWHRRELDEGHHSVILVDGMAHLPCWAHRSEILMHIKRFVKTL